MSPSVPSESSALDATFLVGIELVEFDRHDLPIYLQPQTPWADAGVDDASYGAPLDRLFGEAGEVHVDGSAVSDGFPWAAGTPAVSEDPLVLFARLSDGLALSMTEPPTASEFSAVFDFGADAPAIVHLDEGAAWNPDDGTFDFLS